MLVKNNNTSIHFKARLRKDLVMAVIIFIAAAIFLVVIDAFDRWHNYTRAHEDWELDEIASILLAFFAISSVLCLRFSRHLFKAIRTIEETQDMLEKEREERHHNHKMEALGVMAGGISHEVNNALQPIIGLTEIIQKHLEKNGDKKQANYADVVYQSALHARNIVQQTLIFSKKEGLSPITECAFYPDLMGIIDFSMTAIPSSIVVAHINKPSMKDKTEVLIDKTSLLQVLTNILTNASHAMNGSGHIDLVWDKTPDNQYIKLTVIDDGPGIHATTKHRIFEPFFTTKDQESNSGLGLSTAHGLMQRMGGNITAENASGKGAAFTLYLPIVQD